MHKPGSCNRLPGTHSEMSLLGVILDPAAVSCKSDSVKRGNSREIHIWSLDTTAKWTPVIGLTVERSIVTTAKPPSYQPVKRSITNTGFSVSCVSRWLGARAGGHVNRLFRWRRHEHLFGDYVRRGALNPPSPVSPIRLSFVIAITTQSFRKTYNIAYC